MTKEKKHCPRCGSAHVDIQGDDFFCFIVCLDCGFDESLEYESDPHENTGKGGGGGGSPYKRGGSLRTQKKKNI